MRRADRLFQIIQILRRRRISTAACLAEKLEGSERTIYRDMSDLICSGVPIAGEAGVGYALPRGFDLPPLMFTDDEIEALVLGARIVRSWADPELVKAAGEALAKVEMVLPDRLKAKLKESALFSLNFNPQGETVENLALCRLAIRDRRMVRFTYEREDGRGSNRTTRPLCLAFVAPVWLLSAWCELRDDFRTFRVDRVSHLSVLDATFDDEKGKSLDDFLGQVAAGRKGPKK